MKVQQITLTDMKSQEPQEKKFRQLSDEELEQVNGGRLPIVGGEVIMCSNLTLCAAQGKQLDTKTCKCY